MQFINNGPDIPNALLQAHEEGRVVFFCGAGISYPAGLPGFEDLVKQIYQRTETVRSEIEDAAFERKQFDATLDLLERRLPGQRQAVRHALAQVLKPKRHRQGATDTQAALLRLARTREGELRLVTTNFDRLFHMAAKRTGQTFQTYAAPNLPIPKNSRWNGLVYLHGLLPHKVDDAALNRLVVTSGDFGLAYLTERWAARFVGELFRNYVVCFVGYSINDPVLRYMMDALAADRMLGEAPPQAWALGDCKPGQEKQKKIEWEAKGVTPILYQVPTGSNNHNALHHTLHAWAATYRDGVLGKEAIVVKHAGAYPQHSTQQDDFVGRMLWALSDKSGLPAKRFADLNPVPSLDWLEAFEDKRFRHSDLLRFGVTPNEKVDTKLSFSLLQRPAPYQLALPMRLVSDAAVDSQWDDVMFHLARWLVRHLNDPRLIIWITTRGGLPDGRWLRLIERKLDDFASLEREGKTVELDEICLHAPNAIPDSLMRTLWRLLLNGQIKSSWHNRDVYLWKNRLEQDGLSASLRLQLRELLAPKLILKQPFSWGGDNSSSADKPIRPKPSVDCELSIAHHNVSTILGDSTDQHWMAALPLLLDDFQLLLRDALDLLSELDKADEYNDQSHWDLPSITPHRQNYGRRDWVRLIEWLRDAWLAVRTNDCMRATRIAQTWFTLPYPAFKRLALFAASQDNCISADQWVEWLLSDNAWWLWLSETKREVCRLFVLQGQYLTGATQQRLEVAILAGPPRKMYLENLEEEKWQNLATHSIWLYLAKLKSSKLILSTKVEARFKEISSTYPTWQLAANECDEFQYWISSSDELNEEDKRKTAIVPRKRQELVQWLKKNPKTGWDTWGSVCRTRFFHSLFALYDLSREDIWPPERWIEALQMWAEQDVISRSWRCVGPLVLDMPDDVFQEIAVTITWWIKTASQSIDANQNILLKLCHRVLDLPLGAGTGLTKNGAPLDEPLTEAINHPVGHVTQALINFWFTLEPNDNDLLPAELAPLFTMLCDVKVERFRHARVLLASNLIAFFRVDRAWTEQYLLPLFDWSQAIEVKAAWAGFLRSPRLHLPLFAVFKPQFLETVNHYEDLGTQRQQFVALLTYAALEPIEGYTVEEFRSALAALPQEGLQASAQVLLDMLKGAADQCEEYWKNHVQPFWQQMWPKSNHLISPRIAERLARLPIAARSEFPAALEAVRTWLDPIEEYWGMSSIVLSLAKSGLCNRFPNDALQLLNAIIGDYPWGANKLDACLAEITQAAPHLEQDSRYMRLREYCRRRDA